MCQTNHNEKTEVIQEYYWIDDMPVCNVFEKQVCQDCGNVELVDVTASVLCENPY